MSGVRRAERLTFPQLEEKIGAAVAPLFGRRRLFDALNALALLDEAHSDTSLTELALAWKRDAAKTAGRPALSLREFFDRFLARYRDRRLLQSAGARR